MEVFKAHAGKFVLLLRNNIDTDQIIPKQFLKKIGKFGYGPDLFFDWRYDADGKENPNFEMNLPQAKGASILITGNNFGCGSSREHAVWALVQFGFKVVIAQKQTAMPGFADIFRSNSMKNGLLTLELAGKEHQTLVTWCKQHPNEQVSLDLENQNLKFGATVFPFEFPQTERERFLKGLDDISLTLSHEKDILDFEKKSAKV